MQNIKNLSDSALAELIQTDIYDQTLFKTARAVREAIYGKSVYIRGLIEFTNYCKNDCYYCGIRRSNSSVPRYRLTKQQILECCDKGYPLGFRTFVLQGGEDNHFTDREICDIVYSIKSKYPDCAITLSIGEKSHDSYKAFFDYGANRFLLRHETATKSHYEQLHPCGISLENRMRCLFDLKEIGYQVGSGFMVGSPFQTAENLVADIRFLQELDPDMIGVGPFIVHHQTPFSLYPSGSYELTLRIVAILRIMFEHSLIPSTTALATIDPNGREAGILSGANVVMPNLSPNTTRELYTIYDNKASGGSEAAENLADLKERMKKIGYEITSARGDVIKP